MILRRLFSLYVLAALLLLTGCEAQQPSPGSAQATPPTLATPLPGWEGVNNLFSSDEFFFAGQPDSAALVRFGRETGVGTVINIRDPRELAQLGYDEAVLVGSLGMRYVSIPVTPGSFSVADVDRFADVLSETDGKVLVHCSSSNRVGGLWAAYLARSKALPLDQALQHGEAAGLRSPDMIEATRRVISQ